MLPKDYEENVKTTVAAIVLLSIWGLALAKIAEVIF